MGSLPPNRARYDTKAADCRAVGGKLMPPGAAGSLASQDQEASGNQRELLNRNDRQYPNPGHIQVYLPTQFPVDCEGKTISGKWHQYRKHSVATTTSAAKTGNCLKIAVAIVPLAMPTEVRCNRLG